MRRRPWALGRLLTAAALAAALLPVAARASGPRLSAFAAGGGTAWRGDACGCVDRAVWSGGGGAGVALLPGLWLEVEGEGGAVVMSGGASGTTRFGGALRFDGFGEGRLRPWVRAGVHGVLVGGTRSGLAVSAWAQPGVAFALRPGLLLELGLTLERVFGPMARVELGFRQGLRVTLPGL